MLAGSKLKLITSTVANLGVYGESLSLQVKFVPPTADIKPVPVWNQQGMIVPMPELKPRLEENTSLLASSFVGKFIYILPAEVASL